MIGYIAKDNQYKVHLYVKSYTKYLEITYNSTLK